MANTTGNSPTPGTLNQINSDSIQKIIQKSFHPSTKSKLTTAQKLNGKFFTIAQMESSIARNLQVSKQTKLQPKAKSQPQGLTHSHPRDYKATGSLQANRSPTKAQNQTISIDRQRQTSRSVTSRNQI